MIALDGWVLGSGLGGDEVSFRGVLRGLAVTAAEGDRFLLYAAHAAPVPRDVASWPAMSVARLPRRPGLVHYGLDLPVRLTRAAPRPDLIASVTHSPMWPGVRRALLVADCSFRRHPELFPTATRLRLEWLVPRQARAAAVVLTVSEHSRRDIVELFGIPEERVFVVPNAIEAPVPPDERQAAEGRRWLAGKGVTGPFLLYLGNLHPRKNVARLIRAFTTARTSLGLRDHQLVVAGARWWGTGDEEAAAAAAPAGTVVLLGRVSEDQREHLLHAAQGVAYVSRFEGFGLPPLEAMARGTPVLASRAGALPETTGGSALMVDPDDEDAIADGLVRLASDDVLRADLRRRGLHRAAEFTLARTGLATRAAFAAVA